MATIENPKHLKQMGICFKVSKNEKKNIKWHRMSCKKPNSVLFWVFFLGGGLKTGPLLILLLRRMLEETVFGCEALEMICGHQISPPTE